MANLPGLRMNKYYHYVDTYNDFLEKRYFLKLDNHPRYNDFDKSFQELKKSYSKLNEILYSNLIYGIGEIQNRFLSFPSVEFPTRITFPLLKRLYKAGILRTTFIFNWDDFQGKDRKRLKSFLKEKFGFDSSQIRRIDINNDRAKIVLHNIIEAYVRAYDKITARDDIDADGDGFPSRVALHTVFITAF
jgi:hypothetical protein